MVYKHVCIPVPFFRDQKMPTSILSCPVSPILHWPITFCLFTSAVAWALSVITSNLSQVDRIWTFLPTIYSFYFALLPLWPSSKHVPMFRGLSLVPYTPLEVDKAVQEEFSPRAVLMLIVVVS